MIEQLRDNIRDTLIIVDGYTVGRLIVENGEVSLQTVSNDMMPVKTDAVIEVYGEGIGYTRITHRQAVDAMSSDGWPLFAGLDARIKTI
jgi:hypothetical protein